jgi:hypothetical protein
MVNVFNVSDVFVDEVRDVRAKMARSKLMRDESMSPRATRALITSYGSNDDSSSISSGTTTIQMPLPPSESKTAADDGGDSKTRVVSSEEP